MKKAVIYTLAFLAIQLIAGTIVQGAWMLAEGRQVGMNASMMILSMVISSVTALGVFLYFRWASVSRSYVRSRPWAVLFWCVLAAVGSLLPSVWFEESMPELPNWMEQEFDMVLKDRWGYAAVGLLAPVAEELVFRGAVLRELLSWHRQPWVGIAVSSLIFALVHGNPAQMPHAFIVGLLLGWMYYRTGSIVPCVAFHWVNNTFAYVIYNLYPDPSLKLVDVLGSQRAVYSALFFSLCILLPSLYQLYLRMKRPAAGL